MKYDFKCKILMYIAAKYMEKEKLVDSGGGWNPGKLQY